MLDSLQDVVGEMVVGKGTAKSLYANFRFRPRAASFVIVDRPGRSRVHYHNVSPSSWKRLVRLFQMNNCELMMVDETGWSAKLLETGLLFDVVAFNRRQS